MVPSTERQSFRETVAAVAEQARAILPVSTNGRLESAVKLVLSGDVLFKDDGTVEVGSSDPTRYYRLTGPRCTCRDFTEERAPLGLCKHRIAANVLRSVERVQSRSPQVAEIVEPWADNDPEPEAVEVPCAPEPPAPAPLPEAPASVNVRLTIGGREVQWTLRDSDEARLAVRLDALLARYPVPQAPAQVDGNSRPPQAQRQEGYCAVHNTSMHWNAGKGGRTGWFSHRLEDGSWCKGHK